MMPSWAWQEDASCRGEDLVLFFGPDGERQPERDVRELKAKAICSGCPVDLECLEYALARPERYGLWKLNEDERASERRRRQRRATDVSPAPEPVQAAKTPEKLCLHCDKTLPPEDFGSDVTKKDGRHVWCRNCTNEAARRRRAKQARVVA